MAEGDVVYKRLSGPKKQLVWHFMGIVISALSPDDPTGHFPNCGYTDEVPECLCADSGGRLFYALCEEIDNLQLTEESKPITRPLLYGDLS